MYSFAGVTEAGSCKHKWNFSFHPVGVFHALYKVQLHDKYQNLLKEMCCNDVHLILVLEYIYIVNYKNNATQIFSVAVNVGMVNIHTFYPWPCQILLHRYDAHAVSLSLYISQIGD